MAIQQSKPGGLTYLWQKFCLLYRCGMEIQQSKPGGLERKVISKSLSGLPGSVISIDDPYLHPPMEGYARFFEISEVPNLLKTKSRDFIIELEYRETAALNGQKYPEYKGEDTEIKMNAPYLIPDDVDGIAKKLEIRIERLSPYG